MTPPNLLHLAATSPSTVQTHLTTTPSLSTTTDSTGYTLLHAAASYNHLPLLTALLTTHHLSPNTLDNDGETALFVCETVEAAKILVDHGINVGLRNLEGETAEEKIRAEGEWGGVADYLRLVGGGGRVEGEGEGGERPKPLPPNVRVMLGRLEDEEALGEVADLELRGRIEELASREDFEGVEGQRELRGLIRDALGGGGEREVRRRVG